jgi:hypothetical protein
MDQFTYEGALITARALKQTMTAYSEGALQTALENGCQDRASVLDFLSRRENARMRSQVVNGRKGRLAGPNVPMYRRKG